MSDSREATIAQVVAPTETRLKSVGIDVGSSTTHLTISELVIGRRDSHFHRKPEVLGREIIYRSPIVFTPFGAGGIIDHESIRAFVQKCYSEAGLELGQIDTGAVICTGEAARRQNAEALTAALAKDSGSFVCATAGHHYEALLAAHGSGSVELSHFVDCPTINLDIGGGTAKRSIIVDGLIQNTAAINIGARLLEFDERGVITRSEGAAQTIAKSLDMDVAVGRTIDFDKKYDLAAKMAQLLMEFLGMERMGSLSKSLLLTDAPPRLPDTFVTGVRPHSVLRPFRLLISGGVSEFLYGRAADFEPNDLGPLLAGALRKEINKRIPDDWLVAPQEGIRATVIGACQFTLQASGDTVFVSDRSMLPMRNVPVLRVAVNWQDVHEDAVISATKNALEATDSDAPCALFFGGPKQFGYGKLIHVARAIAEACLQRPRNSSYIFVFAHNVANTVGRELQTRMPQGVHFACMDEIEVGELDYLDIGASPEGEAYLPIVVKSLLFDHRGRPPLN